jgi:hypothetical protein
MPTRLLELVQHYPYAKGAISPDDFLPPPRFTTRRYDALFVRVESEVASSANSTKPHPSRLLAEAFKADTHTDGENDAVWEELKKASLANEASSSPSPEGYSAFNRIFAAETMRLLSLIPTDRPYEEPTSPVFTLLPEREKATNGDAVNPVSGSAMKTPSTEQASIASPTTDVAMTADWAQFSTSGFIDATPVHQALAATLFDTDVEKTEPPTSPRRQTKKRKAATSPPRGRRSTPHTKPTSTSPSPRPDIEESFKVTTKSTSVTVIQLDEAFIDFWSDALLDPISRDWPNFVICKLKNPITSLEKPIEWLVI